MVKAMDMDFTTGLAEIEADWQVSYLLTRSGAETFSFFHSYDEPPPKNKFAAFWAWLVSKFDIFQPS
jgi:amino acid transporter